MTGRVDDLHFLDASNGWVCSGDGRIYHTADGGASWGLQHDDPTLYFRSIRFADPQRGWAGTLISDQILYGTTNGGASWSQISNIPAPRPNAICGLSVASSQMIFGVGSYSGPARMIKSTDGGATWTSTDLYPLATTLVGVFFKNDSEGFTVGSTGVFPNTSRSVVLHTTDGGTTWRQRYVGTRLGEWCWKISFPTSSVGYVSLERFTGPMFVLKTGDAGLTWSELSFPDFNEQGIGFATPSIGWVGGASNPTFGTTDGGTTWAATPWGDYLNRFQFIDSTLGYGSGVTVYKYSEIPLAVAHDSKPKRVSLVAPNPFESNTTIRFSLEEAERVQLFIADPAGRVVRALEDGMRGAGSHVVKWDGRNNRGAPAPAGIYLYVLHAGERHEMGKLVRVP